MIADIRVGEAFKGSAYAFVPARFRSFDLAQGDLRGPVDMRIGDRPALNMRIADGGLLSVIYVSQDSTVTYDDRDKFLSFIEHKDAAWLLDEHARRGLPDIGFTEVYSRYGKSLVKVGDGAGADTRHGLTIEIVALKNPYTDDLSDGLPVQVFYDDAPRADAQVEVFARKADDTVEITKTRTDAEGLAVIPVEPGVEYLIDSVLLREPSPKVSQAANAVWESLWASLTFRVPDQ